MYVVCRILLALQSCPLNVSTSQRLNFSTSQPPNVSKYRRLDAVHPSLSFLLNLPDSELGHPDAPQPLFTLLPWSASTQSILPVDIQPILPSSLSPRTPQRCAPRKEGGVVYAWTRGSPYFSHSSSQFYPYYGVEGVLELVQTGQYREFSSCSHLRPSNSTAPDLGGLGSLDAKHTGH